MKSFLTSVVIMIAVGTLANDQAAVQPGTPAALEAINGKKVRVFLQSMDGNKLTFQPYKATRNITVGNDKVKSLTFFPKYDADAAQQLISSGDYEGAINALAPVLKPFEEYMAIDNNMRDTYSTLIEAYRKTGNYSKTREMATVLIETGVASQVQRGKVNIALIAIEEGDLDTAKKIKEELTSEAAALYLQASIERAEGNPKVAIRTVSGIIINHANDLEWLGPSELLCAFLYMDMLGTNSVITTNSPLHTARQVKNIYGGTSVAADAKELWISLGGEAVEAAEKARQEEMERVEAEKQAQREAERAKRDAEKAEEASGAADDPAAEEPVAETDVTTATEMESE